MACYGSMIDGRPVVAAPAEIGFPRVYAAIKWAIIISLTFLAILSAAFWTMVFTGFAASGFRAVDPAHGASDGAAVTSECAWPYRVDHKDARAVCKLFYNLTPEQRAEVLRVRKPSTDK